MRNAVACRDLDNTIPASGRPLVERRDARAVTESAASEAIHDPPRANVRADRRLNRPDIYSDVTEEEGSAWDQERAPWSKEG